MQQKDKEVIDDLNYRIAKNYLDLAEMYLSKRMWWAKPESMQIGLANEANQNLDFAAEIIARSSGKRWNKLNKKLAVLVALCSQKIEAVVERYEEKEASQ